MFHRLLKYIILNVSIFSILFISSCSTNKQYINISYNSSKYNALTSYKLDKMLYNSSWFYINQNINNKSNNFKINNSHLKFKKTIQINLGSKDHIVGYKFYNDYDIQPNILLNNNLIYAITKNNILYTINDNNNHITSSKYILSLKNDSAIGLAYNNDNIYITSYKGKVISIYNNGEENWVTNLLYPLQSAPIISDNKLFVIANNTIYALDINSGDILWKYQGVKSGISINKIITPTVYQDLLLVGLSNGNILLLRKNNGVLLWSKGLNNNIFLLSNSIIASPIVINNKNVLVSSYNNSTALLNILNGNIIWKINNVGFINNPLLLNNHVFAIDKNMVLQNIDENDGSIFWSLSLPLEYSDLNVFKWFGPFLINNLIMVYNSDGKIYFISPENGEIINTYKIQLSQSDSINVTPIIANDKIVFYSEQNKIYIIK